MKTKRLPLRIKRENPEQKYNIVAFDTMFGRVVAHTFLTDTETQYFLAHGYDCQVITQ